MGIAIDNAIRDALLAGRKDQQPSSDYGKTITQAWGTVRVTSGESVVIWQYPPWENSGYQWGEWATAICRGPITSVARIWADNILVYDAAQTPPVDHGDYLECMIGTESKPGSRRIRIYLGTETQTPDAGIVSHETTAPAYRGLAYVLCWMWDLSLFGGRVPAMEFEVVAGSHTTGDVLADLCEQVGIAAGDRDLTAATTAVPGYILGQRGAARQAADPILQVYATDLAEVNDKLTAIVRGGAVAATLDTDELGAHVRDSGEDAPAPRVTIGRAPDLELPARLELGYLSAARNYQRNVAAAWRATKGDVQGVATVDTGLVLSDATATQAAQRLLYEAWIERASPQVSLLPKRLALTPGARVSTALAGETLTSRITSREMGLWGEIRAVLAQEDDAVLTQSGSGTPGTLPAAVSGLPIPTTFDVWSGKEIRDEDGLYPGFYCAAWGPADWIGASIYYSTDEANWTLAGSVSQRARFGTALGALADGVTPDAFDVTNTVDVQLRAGDVLEDVAQAAVSGGENNLLLGAELSGVADVTDLGSNQWRLATLLRGRRSTAMTGHAGGDRFVLLDSAIARVAVPAALIGQTVYVRCVSPGETVGDVTSVSTVIATNNYPYQTAIAAGTTGQYWRGDKSWQTFADAVDARVLAVATTTGDLLTRSAGGAVDRIATGGATTFLRGGTVPAFAAIALADLPSQAADTILGRHTGSGTPLALSAADVRAALGLVAKTLWVPAVEMWPSTTAGCAALATVEAATNKENYRYLEFAAQPATQENAEFTLAMPAEWDGGTVTATFHWLSSAADPSSHTAIWGLQGYCHVTNGTYDRAWGTAQTATETQAFAVNRVFVTGPTAAITIGGSTPAGNRVIQWRVHRDRTDTYVQAARLLGVTISYTRA